MPPPEASEMPLNWVPVSTSEVPNGIGELVVLMTHGADHELSSVGFTVACGGITAGLKVCAFLTSSAVDLVRRRGIDMTHVQPMDPLKTFQFSNRTDNRSQFIGRGCACGKTQRGYSLKFKWWWCYFG